MTDDPIQQSTMSDRPVWWTIVKRAVMLVFGAVALYALAPLLIDVWSTAPRLGAIAPGWFAIMAALEAASFAAAWGLARLAVPHLGWSVAAMAQLSSNSASRVFPGGAVVGAAVYFRILSAAGVEARRAAAALTVNSLISTLVLFSLPAVAAAGAVVSAPIPAGLAPVAFGGVAVFLVLLALGFTATRFDAPVRATTTAVRALVARIPFMGHASERVSPEGVLRTRDEIIGVVGPRWKQAVGYASANWLLDYLVLVAALYSVGAQPRLSVVLLAYGASAVLTMIPITPGGLGFVEAGLTATLTLAGIPASDALLATLAYRLYAFWVPIPTGGAAYLVFKRRYAVTD